MTNGKVILLSGLLIFILTSIYSGCTINKLGKKIEVLQNNCAQKDSAIKENILFIQCQAVKLAADSVRIATDRANAIYIQQAGAEYFRKIEPLLADIKK